MSHRAPASSATELPITPAEGTPRPPLPSSASSNGASLNYSSQLAALPEELLSNIVIKLGSDDCFSMRLSCREIEAKTLHEFAREYFEAKCFMFSSGSLKVLLGISQSVKLRNYVKKLYFATASINDRTSTCPHGAACSHKPSTRQKEALLDYVADQKSLKDGKKDREYLTKAFRELPNLNFLAVVGDTVFLPPGVECYGIRKFSRTARTSPAYQPTGGPLTIEYVTCLTHVFRTMMLAVAQSGLKSITRLETLFGNDNTCGLSPIADLRFKPSTIDVLSECFANLNDLSICFRSTNLRVDKQNGPGDVIKATKAIKRFSAVFRNTRNLKLSFDFGYASGPICSAFMNLTIDLTKLRTLVLDTTFIDMKSLAAMVCKLRSVEFLTLHHIELSEGGWVPILKALKSLPALQHLHLFYLQAPEGRVFFLENDEAADESTIPSLFDFPEGPLFPATMMGDADEGDWASDSSEGMPDLLEVDAVIEEGSEQCEEAKKNKEEGEDDEDEQCGNGCEAPKARNTCPFYNKDFRDKHLPASTGRGYYVCLQGEADIKEKLAVFEKEYNTGGEGDAGEFDVLLGTLAGGVVGGFPIPVPQPNPNGGQGAAQAAAGAGAGIGQVYGAPGNGAGQGAGAQAAGVPAGAGPPTAMDLSNMLAGLMATNPPPAAGGVGQAYNFNIPLASLLGGGFPPPPAPNAGQNQFANNAQTNSPTPNITSTNGATPAGPSAPSIPTGDWADWDIGTGAEDDEEHPDLD